jgi:hypothetical protein
METEDDLEFSTGVGVQLNFRKGQNLYGVSYSLAGFPLGGSQTDIVQAFSLDLHFSIYMDKTPPAISVKEDIGVLVPSSNSDSQNVFFKLFAEDNESPIDTWHFVICTTNSRGESQKAIRSFSGKGLPPRVIKWDGRDSYKSLLGAGLYTFRLVVTDIAGNMTQTKWQTIEVRD